MVAQVRGVRLLWSEAEDTMVCDPAWHSAANQAVTDIARACGFQDTLRRTAATAYLGALDREGAGILERLRRHAPWREEKPC